MQSWQTASTYLIYSGLSLLAISLHPRHGRNKWAAGLIGGGAIIFSGSIFGLVLAREKTGKILGPITPIGGMGMIIGLGDDVSRLMIASSLWRSSFMHMYNVTNHIMRR